MTALGQLQAGGRLTAAGAQGVAPYAVIKPADESIAGTVVTLQNDDALVLALAANTQWSFGAFLIYEGGTNGSADLKLQWNVPAGSTLRFQAFASSTSGFSTPAGIGTRSGGTANAFGTDGAGVLASVTMWGSLIVGSTTGTLQLQWCTNTSNATATIVHAGSILSLDQLQ